MKRIWTTLQDLRRYPSAVVGLVIILALVGVSIYTLIALPYSEAIRLWRGSEEDWYNVPERAGPAWLNLFTAHPRPETISVSSQDETVEKTVTPKEKTTEISIPLTFDYPYEGFPQEIQVFFKAKYEEKAPFVVVSWLTPTGEEIKIGKVAIKGASQRYPLSQDKDLTDDLGQQAHVGLLAAPDSEELVALQGTYTMQITAITFEPGTDLDAELVLYGQVHGLAGTDHRRRDLMIALLWGTPIALSFGLLAAVFTTGLTMVISGIATWFGGWVDEIIQRVTEINMVLPFLPILIMVGIIYNRSLWLMLTATILLSIFTGAIKTYRAMFIQVRESAYIEAAQAYGASNGRLIFSYLIPRLIPMVIPALVVAIPGFVFLEAALAVLGLGDPVLPTWGKIINEARNNGALHGGLYYWVLEPTVLLMLTGLSFSLLGFSLDRIFNPRLRGL